MAYRKSRVILFAFLAGITLFSSFRYLFSLKEKYAFIRTIRSMEEQVALLEVAKQELTENLEKEKQAGQKLAEENRQLTERLTQLDNDFTRAKETIERLHAHISAVRAENLQLRQEDNALKVEFVKVAQERDALKARLSSLPELKKTIRDIKIQLRLAARQVRQKAAVKRFIVGNEGFIIKDGKSTFLTRTIEVLPAQSQ